MLKWIRRWLGRRKHSGRLPPKSTPKSSPRLMTAALPERMNCDRCGKELAEPAERHYGICLKDECFR